MLQMERNRLITEESFKRIEKKTEQRVGDYRHSVWKDIKKEFLANKIAMTCIVILAIIFVATLFAPLSPHDPYEVNAAQRLQGISMEHWLGTDEFGRDYFTRALYGGRVSLAVGVSAMFVTTTLGTLIGVFSGYIGGKIDTVLMRFTDIFLSLPSTLLMIVLNAVLQPSLVTLVLVLSLFSWASVARITRAETMSLKERDFVSASINLGAGSFRIAITHILPNILGPVIVAASLEVASAILTESSLSFLGLGVQIPVASWGSMLQNAQIYILDTPRLALVPGILILLTVLSFNFLGDVLRTALEPKIAK